MALSRLSLAFSLLFLSLLVIASAGGYGDDSSKYGFDGIPADSPRAKPEGDASSKYGFDGIPADSPQAKPDGVEKPYYGAKPDYNKPKPVEKEKPDYGKKPEVVKSKPEGEEKPNYGTKQDIYTPKPEKKSAYDKKSYVTMPNQEGQEKPNYGAKPEEKPGNGEGGKKPDYDTKPYFYKPKTQEKEKPAYGRKPKPEEKENRLSIGVQGLVLCKSGSKYYPIQGALAKMTCKFVDEVGAEKTLSICSGATDAKGYFFATVSHLDKLKLKECKAYLQSSPLSTCNVATNVNKAIDGAPLSAFRVLKDKRIKLYSVGPFFYTSEAKPASNGY